LGKRGKVSRREGGGKKGRAPNYVKQRKLHTGENVQKNAKLQATREKIKKVKRRTREHGSPTRVMEKSKQVKKGNQLQGGSGKQEIALRKPGHWGECGAVVQQKRGMAESSMRNG